MPEIKMQYGTTDEWIRTVAENAREPERRDFLRHYDSVEEGIFHGISVSPGSQTALMDGEPVAVYGLATGPDPTVLHPWLVLSREVERHPLLVMRQARDWFDRNKDRAEVLTNYVPCDDDMAVRFVESVGFNVEHSITHETAGAEYFLFWHRRGEA